ncbi:MAG TPA: YbhB/YbcL family Raf kinase inhibitor-like protein [Polyangiaceae bacterium]|nr:YbhB/YbcL family Raf kinase inhibitor-like protein [Polyangiaceae bacterium]
MADSKRLVSEQLAGAATLRIGSPAFEPGGRIPVRYTADGAGVSPPLSWSAAPSEAKMLVLVVEDPDAPRADPYVHWVAYDMAPETTALPEGVPPPGRPGGLARMRQGPNAGGSLGWTPPAPPPGHGTHHYHFELFALDDRLALPDDATRDELARAMEGHVLASGELVGTYAR